LIPLLNPHRFERSMQARLDGSDRPPQPHGDVGEGQVRPVVESHDRSLVGIETSDDVKHFVVVEELLEGVGNGTVIVRRQGDEANPAVSSDPIPACVDDDAIEPCLKGGRVSQRTGRLPGSESSIVGDVLGIGAMPEDQAGEPICSVEATGYEPCEPFVGLPFSAQIDLRSAA
jgi:hypothetical protein